ncbi:HAD family hydrolase [Niabella beijingensis]|uniref:HAD family hydrolase n=1 Tax=Niabella beijingensis TaxID=2872700 RepID=UPI001CBDA279|nr:HAD family hydrolase [Niabella beijingensis]MBZ4190323.1 HAD family hydrolase [Niabella beijingensis]
MLHKIKTIAFDTDDTLWENESYFREAEQHFCALLNNYLPHHAVAQELLRTEMKNLPLYGYGIKGFMLCMIETIDTVTGGMASPGLTRKAIEIGHELLQRPVVLLPGVEETLDRLTGRYRLVMATKGDLLDQERKLEKSGLAGAFHHITIMSNKKPADYRKLLTQLDCEPDCFLMLGNSVRSDVLPVLELNGYAAHIPCHTTWVHEQHEERVEHPRFLQLETIEQILNYL